MQRRNTFLVLVAVSIVIIAAAGLWLATASPAKAQCGSQASSCKACHEVQGEMPVNSDGTAWHTSHAFGDFCYICHAGNNQAKGKDEAHTGMADPLSDIKASCQQCHPNDLQERAQVYATALGVEIGSASALAGGAPVAASNPAAPDAPAAVGSVPVTTELDVDDPNLVDYVQRYDEIVLGKKPINWGNAILLGMIGLVVVGGGGFVVTREKLVKVSFGDVRKADDEYPAEVVEMLPAIAGLKAASRKSLRNVLDNTKKAEQVLDLMEAVVACQKTEE